MVRTTAPSATLNTRSFLSSPPLTTWALLGVKATAHTWASCPPRALTSLLSAALSTLTVLSSLAVAHSVPSTVAASARIGAACGAVSRAAATGNCHNRTRPSSPAVASCWLFE
jgi:hypothetical protein